ncbi:exonuclease SbcCD subunit D [Alkalibacter saccharofermentans]|uniref:Nuclease SbcCD subunit D n=1 Tax=Alkalibacter saccharofermentans DSM 14828 TaxID=1120975 RepID=A0A1M4XR39_9FIRM|nr:exonuclease SbcCD subunit D [Alkalibacter saccharofermentans]SHE95905.1 Exodeoxyribonuclease I subunit D [Alkalibacter saccharofermentans DSM 14828]
MIFMHMADLHIGKRVNEFNMLEDQRYILKQALSIAQNNKVDVMLLAGDIYDKSLPPGEAVALLDEFLTDIVHNGMKAVVVSGNHDSPERLAFGRKLMQSEGVYVSGVFNGEMNILSLRDDFGLVNIYMLPFIKPLHVKKYFPKNEIDSYTQAVKTVIDNAKVEDKMRNVLIAHQFVVSSGVEPMRSDSENISVGGLDHVEASAFDIFDYVALGHLHHPQSIGRDAVRYAGSPLKYSFSEAGAKKEKSVTIIEMKDKKNIKISKIPLTPLRDMVEIKGPLKDLLDPENHKHQGLDNYIHATLTDNEEIIDAISKIRSVYPNVMKIDFENSRTKTVEADSVAKDVTEKTSFQLFEEFYKINNNEEMEDKQKELVRGLLENMGVVI